MLICYYLLSPLPHLKTNDFPQVPPPIVVTKNRKKKVPKSDFRFLIYNPKKNLYFKNTFFGMPIKLDKCQWIF